VRLLTQRGTALHIRTHPSHHSAGKEWEGSLSTPLLPVLRYFRSLDTNQPEQRLRHSRCVQPGFPPPRCATCATRARPAWRLLAPTLGHSHASSTLRLPACAGGSCHPGRSRVRTDTCMHTCAAHATLSWRMAHARTVLRGAVLDAWTLRACMHQAAHGGRRATRARTPVRLRLPTLLHNNEPPLPPLPTFRPPRPPHPPRPGSPCSSEQHHQHQHQQRQQHQQQRQCAQHGAAAARAAPATLEVGVAAWCGRA